MVLHTAPGLPGATKSHRIAACPLGARPRAALLPGWRGHPLPRARCVRPSAGRDAASRLYWRNPEAL